MARKFSSPKNEEEGEDPQYSPRTPSRSNPDTYEDQCKYFLNTIPVKNLKI